MPLDSTDGRQVKCNVNGSQVIKVGSGRITEMCTITTGTACALHDCATVGEANIDNQIANISQTSTGMDHIYMPFQFGLVAILTGGAVVSIAFN